MVLPARRLLSAFNSSAIGGPNTVRSFAGSQNLPHALRQPLSDRTHGLGSWNGCSMCPTTVVLVPDATMSDSDYKAPKLQLSLADFELLRRIGDGSYSHVVLARHRTTGLDYALKVIDKQYILRHRVVDYIRKERQILNTLEYQGIASLHFTFQDAYSLYLGLEFCPNGELYDQIRLRGKLPEGTTAAYAAEVVLMLEYLRDHGVVHRDLKPENLLLDVEGHLKLIDFGSAKQLSREVVALAAAAAPAGDATGDGPGKAAGAAQEETGAAPEGEAAPGGKVAEKSLAEPSHDSSEDGEQQQEADRVDDGGSEEKFADRRAKRAVSLVGTADYVSPEILNNHPVTCAADLWAMGCVVYQMLVGQPPFKSPSEYLTFQRIVGAEYELPEGLSQPAADLIRRLLQVDPGQRIGAAELAELKAHPFFKGIDWQQLRSQPAPEYVPDLDPDLGSASSSFDWELQSLASALPPGTSGDHLELE